MKEQIKGLMKWLPVAVCLLFCGPVAVSSVHAAEEKGGYSVAVLPFRSSEDFKNVSQEVTSLVNTYLSKQENLVMVERAELEKVLGEWELSQAEMVSTEEAVKIGHLIGAKVIVTGRVFAVENQLVLLAKIIGVENGRVYGEEQKVPLKNPYLPAVELLAQDVYRTISEKGKTLIVEEKQPEDWAGPLKKLAEGKKLPGVSVKISEEHVRQKSIDPAAETEMSLMFQEIGFPLIDVGSQVPDIAVTGEAFSDFALKRENVVSCKARVEVKVVNQKTGAVIAIDRETATALDLSEAIAAKSALQKAASRIAPRVIEKILKNLETAARP